MGLPVILGELRHSASGSRRERTTRRLNGWADAARKATTWRALCAARPRDRRLRLSRSTIRLRLYTSGNEWNLPAGRNLALRWRTRTARRCVHAARGNREQSSKGGRVGAQEGVALGGLGSTRIHHRQSVIGAVTYQLAPTVADQKSGADAMSSSSLDMFRTAKANAVVPSIYSNHHLRGQCRVLDQCCSSYSHFGVITWIGVV